MASRPERFSRAYRIVSDRYPAFDGAGAQRWGSRWVSPGRRVVHAAQTWSLAVLENLAHWQSSRLPPTLVCVEVQVPDGLDQEQLDSDAAPGWNRDDYKASRAVGDDWYDRGESAVLWVPSLVSPVESNLLFNQQHADFARLLVRPPVRAAIDPRLLRDKR